MRIISELDCYIRECDVILSSLLSGVETRNIQSLAVWLGLYKYKLKIFKHNLLTDMKLSCRQMLALDDDCRLLKTCAALAACNSEVWPLQSTMSTATETQGGGGPEPFPWDYKLAESHWHSESYTIIIKQLCHPLLCPSPPLFLSVTVLIFYFFFVTWKLYEGQISQVKIQKLLKTGGGSTKQQPRVKYTESERMLGPLFTFSSSSPGLRGLNELQRQIVAEAILLL